MEANPVFVKYEAARKALAQNRAKPAKSPAKESQNKVKTSQSGVKKLVPIW